MTFIFLSLFMLGAAPPKKPPADLSVDLNSASVPELMQLPGVGAFRAAAIVRYRQKRRFRSPGELMRVKGFKARTYVRLKPYVRVGETQLARQKGS